ncbi:NmrA family NAD(P)-binding protein [Pedobacter sp. NJ-S-72]
MNIISGASGQVGLAIAADLVKRGQPVKGIIRDEKKAVKLIEIGANVAIGDVHDDKFLKESFQDGETLFVLTPEDGEIEDVLGDTKIILDNYRKAIIDSPIKKKLLVCLPWGRNIKTIVEI